ncbi:MAG: lytic transglycosylase [Gammaproteobacteria bacterium RIFCSPHIGHO2_12_FULL_41_15]|nr:MAG: lytic transglycosylase [Gammaproteobacteria bacterium RIFCSPHIGHO2_12_FULL_41_15]
MNKLPYVIAFSVACMTSASTFSKESFQQYLESIKEEAVKQHIRASIVDDAFKGLTYQKKVVNLDKGQPEKRLTYYKYRNTRIDKYRISMGHKRYQQNKALLDAIGAETGVDPCVMAAIWGLETSYGDFMGGFPVINSLATLGYEGRRGPFFRKQLLLALHILNGDHVNLKDFKGEWAGASGHPQFLPSSWHAYAVDYDGDGKKDIWKSKADAFASMARYLSQNGWERNVRSSNEVILPHNFNTALVNSTTAKPIKEWAAMGIRPSDNRKFPNPNEMATLIQPDGGPYLLTYKNWRVIMSWNRSNYYAGSVTYLADQICKR